MATAESVSATLDATRSCTIQITNMSNEYNLMNPQVYTFSGHCCDPPQPTISSNKTGICAFTKTSYSARGAVGVLTYDLCHTENQACSERIALLFSVPFDYNLYDSIMGVGVFEMTCECDKVLYHCMYEGKDFRRFTRGNAEASGITYKGEMVELRATMSNVAKAIIKLDIVDINDVNDVSDVPDVPDKADISPVVEVKQDGNCCSKFCPSWCRYCCNCFGK